jgi:hypothetical protein
MFLILRSASDLRCNFGLFTSVSPCGLRADGEFSELLIEMELFVINRCCDETIKMKSELN